MIKIICFKGQIVLQVDSMELGDYLKSAIVTISAFILFFIGTLLPLMKGFELIPIFILFLLSALVSFYNKTPLGGFFYGIFTSICFLIGNLLTIVFLEYTLILNESSIANQGLALFITLISDYVPEFISFVSAFASLGLFFGLLGYLFNKTNPEVLVNAPLFYRDYWSTIHSLGKSKKREYPDYDRRFSPSSVKVKGIWDQITSGIKLPPPDIAFVLNEKQTKKGELYDLSSGQILGTNLVNPNDLVSKYKPFILKIPEYSTNARGVRRIVFEKLLENFLGKILKSNIVIPIFGLLSLFFIAWVQYTQNSNPIFASINQLPAIIAICFSIVILIIVWRWSIRSKELFRNRPDERLLILVVYLVLGLLFGFFSEIIFNLPTDTASWVDAWFVWTRWFLSLSLVMGLGYIFIHREVEVVNTYFYKNTEKNSNISTSAVYHDSLDEPFWLKNEKTKNYWVIRFMYFWRYEIAKVPHSDWERVELWFDAEQGSLKWVVSDYHYRELWYEVKTDISSLYVSFFINFHTPIPLLDQQEINNINNLLEKDNRTLLGILLKGKSKEILEDIKTFLDKDIWKRLHPPQWISKYGLQNVAADFSSKIPWRFWRYPYGLEEPDKYKNIPAVIPDEEPTYNQKEID